MQTLNRRTLSAFLALAWIGSAAAAQTTEEDLALAYGDKSMISIATGSPQPITRAPAAATVITARDIAAMGATDLDQALESVPGLHVSMSNVAMQSDLRISRHCHQKQSASPDAGQWHSDHECALG